MAIDAVTPPGPAPRTGPPPRARTARSQRRIAQWVALAPLTAVLAALTIIPAVYILDVSLTDKTASENSGAFVGVDNYLGLLSSRYYWTTMARTVVFVVVAVALQLTLALGLAVAVHGVRRGAPLFRALLLLPMAAAPIAMLFNWRQILNAEYGPLNALLSKVGVEPVDWLGSASNALPVLVAVDTWQWTPFLFVILAGGLASIPGEVFEAASVDGASAWSSFRFVTIPLLLPYIAVSVLFRTIDALKTFDSVQVLTSGGPGSSTTMLNYSIFQQGISFLNLGRSSASAVMFLILCIVLTKVLLSALYRNEEKAVDR